MIRVENIKKYFPIKDGFFNNKSGDVKAVENVSFEIPEGEILGLVENLDPARALSEEQSLD